MTAPAAEHGHVHATAEALTWPLMTAYDLGERLAPDGGRRACWSIHLRCGYPSCGQSVLSTSNDSGAYVWCVSAQLMPALRAHIMQVHREELSG